MLTALQVRHAKPGRHGDAHGLYLVVQDTGSKSWLLRIQHRGRRRDFGLGSAKDLTLSDARATAADVRRMVRQGLDPVKERGLRRKAAPSFETVARECYEAMRGGWKDQRSVSWVSSFERHAFPLIGKKPVDAVDSASVLGVLEPIWLTKGDTARRLLQRIGTVLDYAHIRKLIPEQVSLRSVARGLPRQTKQVTHREAMPYADAPGFWTKLLALPNTLGRDALKLTILTAVRSNETRYATWGEFDLTKGVWSIPGARMKMKEAHVVPLTAPAVELLRRIRAEHQQSAGEARADAFLFPGAKPGKPISDMTMLKVLRDLSVTGATVHGFRSSFADWAAECTDTPKEVVEKALAHRIPNQVEAAYRRTDFFEKRRTLMARWAEHVC